MSVIRYNDQFIQLKNAQSVLDALNSHGASIPFSCRSGICQTCLMQAQAGILPEVAQQGLKDSLKLQNYFLACVCYPSTDLSVTLPDANPDQQLITATVKRLDLLNDEIMQVVLDCQNQFDYRPGQFINVYLDKTISRSYSLASVPQQDRYLHLHVRRLSDGQVSNWIHKTLKIGDEVTISHPLGNCFYTTGRAEQNLLLIGTGSGLAPLYGIIRDALNQGHRGEIHLFHGSRELAGFYLQKTLDQLSKQHSNFHYLPCISGQESANGYAKGRADNLAFQQITDLKNWRVFLCGHPEMVNTAKRKAFLAGASMQDIYLDAFHAKPI
jgi:ferredoxin-NADP reductase/ferredoxin